MPRLHIEEYTRVLAGKPVFIACREGILRDFSKEIVADIKFLNRQGILTTLFHNLPNRFANQKNVKTLSSRLLHTRIVRVPAEVDFYNYVLDYEDHGFKLIFLERKFLIDHHGRRINAMTTQNTKEACHFQADMVANINFKHALEKICQHIECGKYERVHILKAGRHSVKHELFTIEGSGTLIANNFVESFDVASREEDIRMIAAILRMYKGERYLKPRKNSYLLKHLHNFYVTRIDGIIVGCVEKKVISAQTVELGALAIATKFRNLRVGVFTVEAFVREMIADGFTRFICLTNNPRLRRLLETIGFVCGCPLDCRSRQAQSPGVSMFVKEVAP